MFSQLPCFPPVTDDLCGNPCRDGERRDLVAHDGAGPDDRVPAYGHAIGDDDVRPEPDVVVDLDAPRNAVLEEYRSVRPIVGMVPAD